MHKKTFSLRTGAGLADPQYAIRTFPVELRGDDVWVELPPPEQLQRAGSCASACTAAEAATAPGGGA